jgi:hypothetical protein
MAPGKLAEKKALVLLVMLAAGQILLAAEEAKPEAERWRRALERSLLFPGLGQLYEKQYAKAALFASAEVLCLAEVFINARKGNDAYHRYRAAADVAAAVDWRARTRAFDRRRDIAILAGAGVWVLNMIDMFVFAKRKYGRHALVSFHPFFNHETHAIGAGCACRF